MGENMTSYLIMAIVEEKAICSRITGQGSFCNNLESLCIFNEISAMVSLVPIEC
jgi:hypothetical protein